MNISELSLRRPVLATVLNVVIVLFWNYWLYLPWCKGLSCHRSS